MALNRDAILGAVDVQTEKVFVKEWGDDVIVRGLTGEELDAYQASIRQLRPRLDGKGMESVLIQDNMRAKLLVKCLVDEAGERLFTDQDTAALGSKNGRVLDKLYDVAAALSGLSDEEQEAMEGNSETPADNGASTSSSPETSSTAP
ncbi:hypothetical protein [Streptomyces sp. NPDC091215]|uniref:hypothetical protein n=1 Tax=Streptomyces sp. NPDC091215 TaxID=3155192 RepID=UPI00343F3676